MANFGQLVIGAPGSGKTTYAFAIKEYYEFFNRKCCLVNMDIANDKGNAFDIDIRDLIRIEDVMTKLKLGPNGGILYAFSFIEKNIHWLFERIEGKIKENNDNLYLIIDNPGQVEIFTTCESYKAIINTVIRKFDLRLCVVNLVESNNLTDFSKYIFSSFNVLNSMIMIELPQINILSKIDLLKEYKTSLPLDQFKNPYDTSQFETLLNNDTNKKFSKLNKIVCDFIFDYNLISYDVLDVSNRKHLNRVAMLVDKANGYLFNTRQGNNEENMDLRLGIAKNDFEFEHDEEYDNCNDEDF
jgi:GTPase SAR1 family protein